MDKFNRKTLLDLAQCGEPEYYENTTIREDLTGSVSAMNSSSTQEEFMLMSSMMM